MKYVVYSHTDYLDILSVHTDYLKFENNILLINKNNLILDDIYNKYDQVIFYEDSLPYAARLLSTIKLIDSDYFILIHDMDILLDVNKQMIEQLYLYAKENYIERIDLQHENRGINEDSIIIESNSYQKIGHSSIEEHNLSLVRSYLYNVNPSLWKKEALLDILFNFAGETYRSIENIRVDKYCEKYSFYKLYSNKKINSGYYMVTPEFVFLHMTHGGGLMPPTYDKIDSNIKEEYNKILNKYSFNRGIKNSMW